MSDHRPRDPAKLKRRDRLEASLKENLRRRKAQARARGDRVPSSGDISAQGGDDAGIGPDGDLPDVDFPVSEP